MHTFKFMSHIHVTCILELNTMILLLQTAVQCITQLVLMTLFDASGVMLMVPLLTDTVRYFRMLTDAFLWWINFNNLLSNKGSPTHLSSLASYQKWEYALRWQRHMRDLPRMGESQCVCGPLWWVKHRLGCVWGMLQVTRNARMHFLHGSHHCDWSFHCHQIQTDCLVVYTPSQEESPPCHHFTKNKVKLTSI